MKNTSNGVVLEGDKWFVLCGDKKYPIKYIPLSAQRKREFVVKKEVADIYDANKSASATG